MYTVALTNYPNQTFVCNIPINGENKLLKFFLWYNEEAQYWLMSVRDVVTESDIVVNVPLLVSEGNFSNVFHQMGYLEIGRCYVLPSSDVLSDRPSDTTLSLYKLLWGDNYG